MVRIWIFAKSSWPDPEYTSFRIYNIVLVTWELLGEDDGWDLDPNFKKP